MTTITGDNHTNHQRAAAEETPVVKTSAPAGGEPAAGWPQFDGEMPLGVPAAAPAADDGPDPDMPFFQAQQADQLPPPTIDFSTDPATLSPDETVEYAGLMLQRILTSPAVRLEYYNRSRTWHKRSPGTGRDGGNFERQWLRMLAAELPDGKGVGLNTNDFGNIHQVLFLTLRRAMIAVTGHDPHPMDTPGPAVRSFHFIPNDTSNPGGTYNPKTDLGFPLDQP